jgi:DNA-binding CsgD family transcriptional regulator
MQCGDELSSIGEIVELAQSRPTRQAFRQGVLEALERRLGFQGAMMEELDPGQQLVNCGHIGLDVRLIETAREGWTACYKAEIAPLFAIADRVGGVVVDSQVFGRRDRAQRRYYAEVSGPMQIEHMLWVRLQIRGRVVASMAFGRPKSSRPFVDKQLNLVRALAPMLALADNSFDDAPPPAAAAIGLSAREREVASLVGLGYTNREIAMALGTSANTVRNQLVTVFRKAEVTTRAELAGLLGRPDAAK